MIKQFSWTQPICFGCYLRLEGREPLRIKDAEIEKCCICGHDTKEGIYYRINPTIAVFPTYVKD